MNLGSPFGPRTASIRQPRARRQLNLSKSTVPTPRQTFGSPFPTPQPTSRRKPSAQVFSLGSPFYKLKQPNELHIPRVNKWQDKVESWAQCQQCPEEVPEHAYPKPSNGRPPKPTVQIPTKTRKRALRSLQSPRPRALRTPGTTPLPSNMELPTLNQLSSQQNMLEENPWALATPGNQDRLEAKRPPHLSLGSPILRRPVASMKSLQSHRAPLARGPSQNSPRQSSSRRRKPAPRAKALSEKKPKKKEMATCAKSVQEDGSHLPSAGPAE